MCVSSYYRGDDTGKQLLAGAGKMTEAEQALAAIADAEMPELEIPARLWRVLPYESARSGRPEVARTPSRGKCPAGRCEFQYGLVGR